MAIHIACFCIKQNEYCFVELGSFEKNSYLCNEYHSKIHPYKKHLGYTNDA